MDPRILELQRRFPNTILHTIEDNVLIGCFPEVKIQEEIRWPVLNICIGNDCQYILKLADENSIEPLVYGQIANSNLTPKISYLA